MPGNHPKEDILYSKHGESLKSRIILNIYYAQIEKTEMQLGETSKFVKENNTIPLFYGGVWIFVKLDILDSDIW
jgi:hypothetical protein